ncbi:hypothetical protein [Terrabacter carboxydivorans]|uniref:Uncharacterized protein n=1 Tax=Terrabacter carboxydivorans TaxID=619730 RepID=A0ABP5ZS49_9MICO
MGNVDDPLGVEEAICPVTAAPSSPTDVSPADVVAGQLDLARLTGNFLPPPETQKGPGATVVSGGGNAPITSRDYEGRGSNQWFGYLGEQDLAFWYGAQGWDVLLGPSGAGGKSSNAQGLDLLAWKPQTKELDIPDNKSKVAPGLVSSATAINENLEKSLRSARDPVQTSAHPDRVEIAERLDAASDAVKDPANNRWPDKTRLTITNAGGYATGESPSLRKDFAKRHAGLTTADGQQVRIGFDNVQPPATTTAAAAGARAVTSRAQPANVSPESYLSAPMDAIREPFEGMSRIPPPTRTEIAEGALAAAPVLLDWTEQFLTWLLPRLGVKDAVHHALDRTVRNQVGPYLRQHPDLGALLVVHQHVHYQGSGIDARPNWTVESVVPTYGSTASEAYQNHVGGQMWEAPHDVNSGAADWYYWLKGGTFSSYNPHNDMEYSDP